MQSQVTSRLLSPASRPWTLEINALGQGCQSNFTNAYKYLVSVMIDIFLKLVDRLISLVKQRQDDRRQLFDRFVEPAYESFEEVHKQYLEAFRSYKEVIKTSRKAMDTYHPVFVLIHDDRLFKQNVLNKCWALEQYASDDVLGPFVRAIVDYLEGSHFGAILKSVREVGGNFDSDKNWETLDNMRQRILLRFARESRIEVASETPRKEVKKAILNKVDATVAKLQTGHEAVAREYEELRDRLLRPR